jgi:heme exporter protein CcmD
VSHGFYLWAAYAVSALAVAAELAWLAARRARALRGIEEERDLEAQD